MFLWRKKTEETKVTTSTNTLQKRPISLDLSELAIEGLGEGELEIPIGNDELTEADLADPVLLGELQALVSGNEKLKPKVKLKPATTIPTNSIPILSGINHEAINALTKDVADEDIELTEEDMNDPKLLNELQALEYDNNDDADKNGKD